MKTKHMDAELIQGDIKRQLRYQTMKDKRRVTSHKLGNHKGIPVVTCPSCRREAGWQ